MQRVSVQNKFTALRAKELGALGETIAPRYLKRAKFTDILDMNTIKTNYPYADVVATRDGIVYAISIKTRNKYEARTGNLNSEYKLGKNCMQLAEYAAKNKNATPAWLAIQIDGERVSVFFGTLEMLNGNKGIPMTPDAVKRYERLAYEELHGCKVDHLKNVYELRQPTKPSTAT